MSKEIKMKIDELFEELEANTVPGMFVLNLEAERINKKITALQDKCKHSFVNGQCKFCYRLEETNNG